MIAPLSFAKTLESMGSLVEPRERFNVTGALVFRNRELRFESAIFGSDKLLVRQCSMSSRRPSFSLSLPITLINLFEFLRAHRSMTLKEP